MARPKKPDDPVFQAKLLRLLTRGLTREECAAELECSADTVARACRGLKAPGESFSRERRVLIRDARECLESGWDIAQTAAELEVSTWVAGRLLQAAARTGGAA